MWVADLVRENNIWHIVEGGGEYYQSTEITINKRDDSVKRDLKIPKDSNHHQSKCPVDGTKRDPLNNWSHSTHTNGV